MNTKSSAGWSDLFASALAEMPAPRLASDEISVGSDYSGSNDSVWWTIGFIVVNGLPSDQEDPLLREFSQGESTIPSYKEIRSASEINASVQFLKVLDGLNGHALVFGSKIKLRNLSLARGSEKRLHEQKIFTHEWTKEPTLERMMLICHVLSRFLDAAVRPSSRVHWITDHDPICELSERRADVVSTINSLRRHYSGNIAGDVLIATPRDEQLPDAAKLLYRAADLMAGCFNQKIMSISDLSQTLARGKQVTIAPQPTCREERYSAIEGWLAKPSPSLSKQQFLLDEDASGLRLTRVNRACS